MLCQCPLGNALPDLDISECKEDFGQVQRVIFQRVYKTPGVFNELTDTEIKSLESMTPFFAAVDGTKMLISPFLNAPTTEPGAAKTFGSGNQVVGGIPINIGREPTAFTSKMYKEAQKTTIKSMKQLMCENIGVYLIDENGSIGCKEVGESSAKKYRPFPIRELFVGDKNLGGLEEPDGNDCNWHFLPNWSDDFVIVTPDYDPLSNLVNGNGGSSATV